MSVYNVQDNRRFRRDPDPGSSGIFRCRVCSKRTRETGFDEAGVQLCKACLFASYRENSHSDNGHAGKGLGPDPHKCTVCTADYPVLGAAVAKVEPRP